MGNSPSSTSSSIRVVTVTGTVQHHHHLAKPVSASELMLKNPGQFVCDSSNLCVGHRVPGLAGDKKLEPGKLYFLLPMDMLYSVLTEDEMRALAVCRHSANRLRSYIGRRIFPALSEFCLSPADENKAAAEEEEKGRFGAVEEGSRRRWTWRPALDTIDEIERVC